MKDYDDIKADLAREKALLKEICDEWNEDCEPSCDSYTHAENCKAINIAEAKKALRERAEQAEADLAREKEHSAGLVMEHDRDCRLINKFASERDALAEQRDKLQRAFDLFPKHGYCKCHDAIEPMAERLRVAREALAEIADPVKSMRERADAAGDKLEPIYARMLSEDHYFLKSIAREAIERTKP